MANSQQFYNRLNQIAGTSKIVNEKTNINNATLIDLERANDGMALGIIKENHSYFVKVSKKSGNNLSVTDFAYIGGIQNVKDYQFSTLSEAQKQRNFKLRSLNESFSLTGKAHLLKENDIKKTPSLEVKTDIGSFLRNRIKEGKKSLTENREVNFKSTLTKEKASIANKKSSMLNEVALTAIQKALGVVNEDKSIIVADSEENPNDSVANKTKDPLNKTGKDLSTEDSEIKDGDEIANKKGKEASTAPINDTNAKSKADKAMGKDKIPAKPKSGKSIAVNEEDLSTADSEILDGDILPNKKDTKEGAQAPINDTNAKTEADKNNVGGVSEGKAISTEDSDLNTKDSVAQDKEIMDKPDAEYNSYNQPEKGHKEKKGETLKPIKQKGAIVAEGDALTTEDSEADPGDSIANKTNAAPKANGESLIVADSELEPSKSLANETNAAPKKSGDSLIVADSELNPSDSLANKTNIREGVEDDIEAAKDKVDDLDVADAEADVAVDAEVAPEQDTGDIDIDNMDLDVDAEPSADGEEEEIEVDADVELGDVDGGEEIPTEPEGDEDDMTKEIEKLSGKLGHALQSTQLEPDKTDEILTSILGSMKDSLAAAGAEKGQEFMDTIEKFTAGEGVQDNIDDVPVDNVGGDDDIAAEPDATGMDLEQNQAIDSQIDSLGVEEDTPTLVDGEPIGDDIAADLGIEGGDEEMDVTGIEGGDEELDLGGEEELEEGSCSECGTFESFVNSKGVNLEECSGMEMADMISGYADAHKEGQNDGDFEGVAVYLGNPQVKQDVIDYGHDDYVGQAEPFIKNVGENNGVSFGSYEPMVRMGEDDEDPTDDASAEIEDIDGGIGDEEAPMDSIVPPETNIGDEEEEEVLDLTNLPEKPEPTFGLGAEVMGGGVIKPESASQKSVDVDLKTGKVIVTMNEEEKKIRKLIRYKLDEKFGKRKPSINENKKSKSSKMIDKMIAEQLKIYEGVIGKKIGK